MGQLALAVTAICGAGLLDQDATTGRLTMRSSTIYGLISSVMQLARWTAYASFCSMIASFKPQSPQRMTSSCLIAAAFNRSRPVPDKGALAPSRERSLRLQLAPQDAKRFIPEVATKAT